MDVYGNRVLWNKIRTKLEKGEEITPNDIVWGVISNGGFKNRKDVLGDAYESLSSNLKDHTEIVAKSEDELKALYKTREEEHDKELKDSKEFFKKLQDRFKEIKSELNKAKIGKISESCVEVMRGYLDMLNREIIQLSNFPTYEEWKKDVLDVSQSQVEFLKTRIKKAKKELDDNVKELEKLEKKFPIPDEMKAKFNGTNEKDIQ